MNGSGEGERAATTGAAASGAARRGIPAGVWVLGFVSMLMDISSEMIHALLPLYMVTVLGTYVLPAVTALIQGMQNVGTWARDSFGVFLDVAEWLYANAYSGMPVVMHY